jgi:transcriptional regulator with XRE-family HTH domain
MKEIRCIKCKGSGVIQVTDLAARRHELGLSQSEVARLAGCSRENYAMLESSYCGIGSRRIRPLAQALQVTTDELLGMVYDGKDRQPKGTKALKETT